MQYTLIDLLKVENICTGLSAADAREAIDKLSGSLVSTEDVTLEFAADVWKREQTFPTGLPTQPVAVAIPHADPDHVLRSAVAVGVLDAPVQFAQMGTDGSTVLDVRILFVLAIKEKDKQVEMIQQLVRLIQSANLLVRLSAARDPADALEMIRETLA
jgi:PTS system galactitol-specific IIA component